jgi:CubicO group peptidase (beta-lactamase class C family)
MRSLLFAIALALASNPASATKEVGPTDPAELEAFLAGLLPALMDTYHVPGAVFVMVKDGETFFAKGYGYADLETRRPVDPDTTLFRVASVSKLFTATAAMQLVEQGKLDLHTDVNRYLKDFQIEEAYGKPVTLHHLLTHTGGFDDRFLRTGLTIGSPIAPLGQYLADRMPPRVMPPGEIISYSNHGIALVGHLVEAVSGVSFTEYVDEHVLGPLGMKRSRFFLSVPLSPDLASPYEHQNGEHADLGYDHDLMGPAAELNTSGTDMARFMIAHLQLGRFENQRILGEKTARLMHSQQFTHHPNLDGWCYGFYEGKINGVRTIGHGGDWRGFHTSLVLVPEAGIGFFTSINLAVSGPFYRTLVDALMDRYFPASEAAPPTPPSDFEERANRYTGAYISNRRIRGSILKLADFLSGIRVTAKDDQTLMVHLPKGSPAGDHVRLVEIGPHLFREPGGEIDAAFLTDARGEVRHLALEQYAFDRVSALRSPRVHAIVAGAVLVLFAGTLVGWLLGGTARLLGGAAASPFPLPSRLVAGGACLLNAFALVGLGYTLRDVNLYDLLIEVPPGLRLLLALPLLSVPLTLALPYFAWRGPTTGQPALLPRLHYWLLTAAALLTLALAHYWNLLGFRY